MALPFVTSFGDIIADSKFELAVDPSRFLGSALVLWNPQQFGQLQDQAVVPVPDGPVFELGKLASVTAGCSSGCGSALSSSPRLPARFG